MLGFRDNVALLWVFNLFRASIGHYNFHFSMMLESLLYTGCPYSVHLGIAFKNTRELREGSQDEQRFAVGTNPLRVALIVEATISTRQTRVQTVVGLMYRLVLVLCPEWAT